MKTGLIASMSIISFLNPLQKIGQTKGYENIGVEKFQELMKQDNTILIDVRTPLEINSGKIENALELDFMNRDFESQLSVLDKDATYLVYCRSGRRSARTCSIMHLMGFNSLYNLSGGYLSWSKNN